MEKIYRAGLVPFFYDERKGEYLMYFMVPSDPRYGGADPQIAKGKMEEGETGEDTALRESAEELGLKESNITDLFDCGTWLGRTHMFAAVVKDKRDFNEPHDETDYTIWMTLDQFNESGRDIHQGVVNHMHRLVSSINTPKP